MARLLDTARIASTIVRVLQQTAPERDEPAQRAIARALERVGASELVRGLGLLEYAQRLAPADAGISLAIGLVRLVAGDPRASEPLALIVRQHSGGLEAALYLAAALRMVGDSAGAAAALARALSRNAPARDPSFLHSADQLAAAVRVPGWCAVSSDGLLHLGGPAAAWRAAEIELRADGVLLAVPPASRRAAAVRRFILPPSWRTTQRLEVRARGFPLLGSPLRPARVARAEGFVEAGAAGGLTGWCWLPADPDAAPVITVSPAGGRSRTVTVVCGDEMADARGFPLLARPRPFAVAPEAIPGDSVVRVTGPGGGALYGSPLRPNEAASSARLAAVSVAVLCGAPSPADAGIAIGREPSIPVEAVPPARARRTSRREHVPLAVVVPVYRGAETTLACLRSVLQARGPGERIIVVSDASPEPELVRALRRLAAKGAIELKLLRENLGFPGAANVGLRLAEGCDVVLLNSDTLVPPAWQQRLREAVYSAPDIGTATPLSNDATIFSYPLTDAVNPVPDAAEVARLATLARACAGAETVEVPTGHGFCLFIRAACLAQTGLLRDDVFAQGYGEENDFCLRARALGWRHVAACGAYVGHVGSQSFAPTRSFLVARNLRILNRLHPGYDRLVQDWLARDPLADHRRRMDLARFHDDAGGRRAVLLVTHDRGGGVLRHVRARAAAHAAAGDRAVILRPARRDGAVLCLVGTENDEAYPNLRFEMPEALEALLSLLREARVRLVELHHFIGHHPELIAALWTLSCPVDAVIHDYAWFCPRITLLTGGDRYCGEPPVSTCADCVADNGGRIEEDIAPRALVERSRGWLRAARAVVAPSWDAARRIERHFAVPVHAGAWEAEVPVPAPRPRGAVRRICVPGAVSVEKGFDVLLALVRHVTRAGIPLEMIVVGYTCDDERLLDAGRVRITGPYEPGGAVALLREQAAEAAFLPSIWPETWSYALSEAWQAGLPVVAFDIGAPAERIRQHGGGVLLPLHTPVPRIAAALLTLPSAANP